MRVWPVSTRVNKPESDAAIVEPVMLAPDAA
jgi:hypothetical protein